MSEELRPCPFCGSEVQDDPHTGEKYPRKSPMGGWIIHCECCGASLSQFRKSGKGEISWNTRPIEDALTARIAELGSELGRKSVELGELVGENILWKVINDKLKSSRENLERENDRLQEKVSDLLKRIAELETERRWIPVSERMPDDWESVLTIDISKSTQDVVTAFYNPEMSLWSTHFSYDLWVTHWMRLPELPKEREE